MVLLKNCGQALILFCTPLVQVFSLIEVVYLRNDLHALLHIDRIINVVIHRRWNIIELCSVLAGDGTQQQITVIERHASLIFICN